MGSVEALKHSGEVGRIQLARILDVDRQLEVLAALAHVHAAHLLAVSGAHVAVVLRATGAAVLWLCNRLRWVAARGLGWRCARVLPLPLAGFFVMMTGESPASVRALVSGVAHVRLKIGAVVDDRACTNAIGSDHIVLRARIIIVAGISDLA